MAHSVRAAGGARKRARLLMLCLLLPPTPIIGAGASAERFPPPIRDQPPQRRRAAASTSPLSSFAVLPRRLRRKMPGISEEIGCSPALNYELFDPLNLADDETFPFYREAELKHGRVAMLATVGMAAPEFFRDNLVPRGLALSPSRGLAFEDVPSGLGAVAAVPWEGWLQIAAAVGFVELFVLRQRDARDMPGDYGVGYFGLRDKGRHERSLLSELENGRLAMIVFVVQVVLELVTGKTLSEQWSSAMHG